MVYIELGFMSNMKLLNVHVEHTTQWQCELKLVYIDTLALSITNIVQKMGNVQEVHIQYNEIAMSN